MLIHEILPRMRDRGHGCIINIASRSGTVDVPMTLGYVTSKAALIRATHTLQMEMELDGLDPAIHMYALHPGGVKGNMGGGKSPSLAGGAKSMLTQCSSSGGRCEEEVW